MENVDDRGENQKIYNNKKIDLNIHLNPSPSDIIPNESNPVNTRAMVLNLWWRLDGMTG